MITKNYIKMCEENEEIQKEWKPTLGDWVYLKNVASNYKISLIANEYPPMRYYRNKSTWLPTQEQLQEMVKDWLFYITGSFTDIYASASTGNRDSHVVCNKAKSMNELWLIFVMKERYHKIWTGKKWEER